MPEEIGNPDEEKARRTSERDARLRAGIYVALAAAAVVVLMTLAFFGRSERVFAAGRALGLEDVAVALEQQRLDYAREKLREIGPELMRMGWDTTPEVDQALQRIRMRNREVYLEALRYLTGRKRPGPAGPGGPRRDVWPRPQPQVYPSAI